MGKLRLKLCLVSVFGKCMLWVRQKLKLKLSVICYFSYLTKIFKYPDSSSYKIFFWSELNYSKPVDQEYSPFKFLFLIPAHTLRS